MNFAVMRVVSPHPDWDEQTGDSEHEIKRFDNKSDANDAVNKLGSSSGDATHRAYYHYVKPLSYESPF